MFIKGAASGAWRVYEFYKQGFSAMKLGKTLWKLILIKLFVIFVVLKFFVFDANLNSTFANDMEKSEFVLDNLTHSVNSQANSNEKQVNLNTISTFSKQNQLLKGTQ